MTTQHPNETENTMTQVNWTRNGQTGISTNGYMITAGSNGWHVFDQDCRLLGTFPTKSEASEQALEWDRQDRNVIA